MGETEARMCKETERYNMLLCAFSGTGEPSVRAGFRVWVSGKTRSCKWGGMVRKVRRRKPQLLGS